VIEMKTSLRVNNTNHELSLDSRVTLVDRYPLSGVKQAYDDFEHGRLVARAVVIPAGREANRVSRQGDGP